MLKKTQDPGGWGDVKLGLPFASSKALILKQPSSLRRSLCLSRVLVNGLQAVRPFHFFHISFAFVLHIIATTL